MKHKILIFAGVFIHATVHAVIFNGLVETGVSRNSFLCSDTNAATAILCSPADSGASGFNLSGGKMLQLFNDQAYWLHQESVQQQYTAQILSYSGSDLQNKMTGDGWGAMGGYCIIISTDPILTGVVMPDLIAKKNQEKVVVQLWYNGIQLLQLWSQDAQVLPKGQGFHVLITTDVDPLPGLTSAFTLTVASSSAVITTNANSSLRANFLSELYFQENNRDSTTYNVATQSPRSIKIQGS